MRSLPIFNKFSFDLVKHSQCKASIKYFVCEGNLMDSCHFDKKQLHISVVFWNAWYIQNDCKLRFFNGWLIKGLKNLVCQSALLFQVFVTLCLAVWSLGSAGCETVLCTNQNSETSLLKYADCRSGVWSCCQVCQSILINPHAHSLELNKNIYIYFFQMFLSYWVYFTVIVNHNISFQCQTHTLIISSWQATLFHALNYPKSCIRVKQEFILHLISFIKVITC